MSATIIDLPKIAQMLDNGWQVRLYVGGLKTYTAVASHPNPVVLERLSAKNAGLIEFVDEDGEVVTDDFTPEQALTRLAYKVQGDIL